MRAPTDRCLRRYPAMACPIVTAALLAAMSRNTSAEEGRPPLAPPANSTSRWHILGAADQPTVIQSLGAGRALICNERRCDVWDRAGGGWTPTGAVVLPINTLSYFRRNDGAVVAIDGARKIAS